MKDLRILLADDQREMTQAVAQLLEGKFEIVGTVENGKQLIEAEARLQPDLIVLDISMPVMNGLQAAAGLKAAASRAKIIFLTVHEDSDFVSAALLAGASGYVLKPRLATDLIVAIREVLNDHVFISPTVETEGMVSEPL